jgi:hypothetical protein
MKKNLTILLFVLFLSKFLAQPLTLTVNSSSGVFSLTCSVPSITLYPVTNYTAGIVVYTLNANTYTSIGSSFNINSPGNYTITAFVSNNLNVTQTLSIGMNTIAPTSTVSPLLQFISCINPAVQTITATCNPIINVSHEFRSPLGGTMTINAPTAFYNPGPGTYTHVLINLTNGCFVSKTFTISSASGFPTYSISSPQNFSMGCSTKSVVNIYLINGVTSPLGGILNYSLSTITNTAISQNHFTLTTSGNYTVTGKDFNTGCETKIPISITLNTLIPTFNLSIPTQILDCNLTQTILQAINTSSNNNYSWNPGNILNPSILVLSTNITSNTLIANYTLTVKDNYNYCETSTVIPIYQNLLPPNTSIGTASGGLLAITTCTNSSIIIVNQSTTSIPSGGIFNNSLAVVGILWNGPPPQTPASNTNTYIANVPGIYSLTAKDLNNGCVATKTINVLDNRVFPSVNNPIGPNPFCLDVPTQTIGIYPIITGNSTGFNYYWSAPPLASAPAVTSPTLTTNMIGNYTVMVTDPSNGCQSTGTVSVIVCIGITSTIKDQSIKIYPNPSHDKITLKHNLSIPHAVLEIYNELGQLIEKQSVLNSSIDIDLTHQKNGMYLFKFLDQDKLIYQTKLLKE